MQRRSFLAVVGAGVLTGCGGLTGQRFTEAEDPFGDIQPENSDGVTTVSSAATVDAGAYAVLDFTVSAASRLVLTGEVTSGGPIDVYLMTLQQLNEYKRESELIGRGATTASSPSAESFELSAPLNAPQYNIVFDNTHVGETQPEGPIELEFEARIEATATPTPTPTESAGGGSQGTATGTSPAAE